MKINRRQWTWVAGILFLVTSLLYLDIAWNETLFRLGIYLFPLIYGIGLLTFLVARLIFKRDARLSFNTGLLLSSFLLGGAIVSHRIDKYKPTLTLTIPEGVEGCIYVFQINSDEVKDTTASPFGIAYLPYSSQYHLKIEQGDEDITSVLEAGSSNEIPFYNEDSTRIRWTSMSCFNISDDSAFSKVGWSWVQYECMDKVEFESYIREGLIDTSQLRFKSYIFTEQDLQNRR